MKKFNWIFALLAIAVLFRGAVAGGEFKVYLPIVTKAAFNNIERVYLENTISADGKHQKLYFLTDNEGFENAVGLRYKWSCGATVTDWAVYETIANGVIRINNFQPADCNGEYTFEFEIGSGQNYTRRINLVPSITELFLKVYVETNESYYVGFEKADGTNYCLISAGASVATEYGNRFETVPLEGPDAVFDEECKTTLEKSWYSPKNYITLGSVNWENWPGFLFGLDYSNPFPTPTALPTPTSTPHPTSPPPQPTPDGDN